MDATRLQELRDRAEVLASRAEDVDVDGLCQDDQDVIEDAFNLIFELVEALKEANGQPQV